MLQDDNLVPVKWPPVRVMEVHSGDNRLVRVVTVKTGTGVYKPSITKMALLLLFQE